MTILDLRQVVRRYGSGEALAGVDLTVTTPQVIGLVGRNGAGKSTLLKLLPPLIHPSAGQVRVFGEDPWTDPEALRQRLGYLADQDEVPPGVRVRDLLDLGAAVYHSWDRDFVRRFLVRMAIDPQASFTRLSRGMQRQVSLLMAIGHRPSLLLLDEPAGNLDPAVRREVLGVLIDLLAEAGTTVVLATHLLGDLERLAERLVILDQGRVAMDAPLDQVAAGLCRVDIVAQDRTPEELRRHALVVAADRVGDRLVLVLACPAADATPRLAALLGAAVIVGEVQGLTLEDAFIYRTRRQGGDPGLATGAPAAPGARS